MEVTCGTELANGGRTVTVKTGRLEIPFLVPPYISIYAPYIVLRACYAMGSRAALRWRMDGGHV
eukprot:3940536-Rhodomonas_salina.3